MNRRIFLILAILVTFAFASHAQTRRRKLPPRVPKPIPTGAVKTPSGLTYIITKKGLGRRPKVGETVVVNYTGTLTNGVKFDSSLDAGRSPISFPLGRGRVIKGWDEGIAKLRIGDQAIFVIPAGIAYGTKGAGNGEIPPDATLIFIVELVDIK